MRLLGNCRQIAAKGEVFHPRPQPDLTARETNMLRKAAGYDLATKADLVAWRRQHPRLTLEFMFKEFGGRPIAFKLFPGHLTRRRIAAELLTDPSFGCVILRRRPIDCFISERKAREVGSYAGVETTDILPTLRPTEFLSWAKSARRWYGWLARKTAGRTSRCAYLSFENHLYGQSNQAALANILESMESIGLAAQPLPSRPQGHIMQDSRTDYRARVANWDEFAAALRPDHADTLAWAETAPDANLALDS